MNLKQIDFIYLLIVIFIVAALPFGISAYDRHVWEQRIPGGAKVFLLTGHTKKGWVEGAIDASDILTGQLTGSETSHPVFKVHKGDTVVLKLTSSDVVHGFSLKDFGVFVNDGIHPGRPVTVSFKADKTGTFTFACNAICGSHHENMSGTIIVSA